MRRSHAQTSALVAAAREAFDAYAVDGKVRIVYQTQWHAGQLR